MSIRDRFPPAKLPRSHYFLTVSRGEKVRALAVRPAIGVDRARRRSRWSRLWACGATAFIALHDSMVATLVVARDADRDRLSDRNSPTRAPNSIASPAASCSTRTPSKAKCTTFCRARRKLEQRGAALAALAAEAGADATALAQAKPRATPACGERAYGDSGDRRRAPTDGDHRRRARLRSDESAPAPASAPHKAAAARRRPGEPQPRRAGAGPLRAANSPPRRRIPPWTPTRASVSSAIRSTASSARRSRR